MPLTFTWLYLYSPNANIYTSLLRHQEIFINEWNWKLQRYQGFIFNMIIYQYTRKGINKKLLLTEGGGGGAGYNFFYNLNRKIFRINWGIKILFFFAKFGFIKIMSIQKTFKNAKIIKTFLFLYNSINPNLVSWKLFEWIKCFMQINNE